MNILQILSTLLPVLIVMSLVSAVELLLPLRQQRRFVHGRVATNLMLVTFNLIVGAILNVPLLAGAVWVNEQGGGLFRIVGITGIAAMMLSIVLLDFVTYATHVALHKVPWLWRVHLVHHNDVALDVTTSYRHHPLEPLLRWCTIALVAWILGVPIAALALYRTLGALNGILEHANIRVPHWLDRSLIWFWVTPDMHKIHHSRTQTQTDSNYSNLFSCYDRLFGTFIPTDIVPTVSYGIDGFDADERQTFWSLLQLPFKRKRQTGQAIRI